VKSSRRAHLVVGGGGGLGEHVVAALGARSDPVVVGDIDLAAAERVAAAAVARNVAATAVAVDVRDTDSVEAAIGYADGIGDGLFSVVNAAGVGGRYRIEDLSDERLAALLDVNFVGTVRVTRAAVPALRRRGGGVVVNVASAAALRPNPGSSGYAASKGAVVAFSRSVAAELAGENIRVWAVCPPAIEAGMYLRVLATEEDADRLAAEARRPVGRVVQPQEVADLIAYLVAGTGPPYGAEPYVV
jgi:NAD(P)-dependent dehydrogenase (short-subunit alcohol dehydrogenase family)